MYLEKMKITHFRKFNEENNEFVIYNHPVEWELILLLFGHMTMQLVHFLFLVTMNH